MVVNMQYQAGRERWLIINRQTYATSFVGNAPLARAAARHRQRSVALAHALCADSLSTQHRVDYGWAGRGAESPESSVGAARRSRDLAPRASDLGSASVRAWGGSALPRFPLADSTTSVAKAAACKLTSAPPRPSGEYRAGEVPKRRPWPKRAIAGWRLPALFSENCFVGDRS